MTPLEAINTILASVGETPVLTLVSGAADTVAAQTVLDAETRIILATGWAFNTDDRYPLAPDSQGRIPVPADVLDITPTDRTLDYVMRGAFMYDRGANTFVIAKTVTYRVVRSMAFADVPFDTQRLIVAHAAKKYQQAYVGSPALDEFAAAELLDAIKKSDEATSLSLYLGMPDTLAARAVLASETRKVLLKGWTFNTDNNVSLVPDSQGRIAVPADALTIDNIGTKFDLVKRGGFMYDRLTNTNVLNATVQFTIVRDVAFNDIPFDTQRLIISQASKKYQQAYGGNPQLDAFAKEDLIDAIATQADAQSDSEDYNLLDNPDFLSSRRWTYSRTI